MLHHSLRHKSDALPSDAHEESVRDRASPVGDFVSAIPSGHALALRVEPLRVSMLRTIDRYRKVAA
jgi:hypothetical protein